MPTLPTQSARFAVLVTSLCFLISPAWGDNWEFTRSVRTGSMPWSVTVSADGAQLWVSMVGRRDHENVWRYDADTLKVEAKSSFIGHAVESELVADEQRLLVTNSRVDLLMELDAQSLKVLRRIRTDRIPKDFDVSPDQSTAYIANYGAGTLSAIRLKDGKASHVKTGKKSRGATVAPDGSEVYVMVFGERDVVVVDTSTLAVTDRIPACKNPRHAVVIGKHLLVTCYGTRHVVVIDRETRKLARTLEVGRGPKTIARAPRGDFAVTANEKGDSISIIDTTTWTVTTIAVAAQQPCGVAVAPGGERIYITARGSHRLLEMTRRSSP